MIDKLIYERVAEIGHLSEGLKNGASLKNKDLIIETLAEFERRGNYVRIYPSCNSNLYDQFF